MSKARSISAMSKKALCGLGSIFGERCPYPDFQNADKRYVTQAVAPIRAALRPYKKWLEMGVSWC
jgi:hypothetical protein